MKFCILFAVIGVCWAEKFQGYPKTKPQGPRLELPNERSNVEITKENIVFAGQTTARDGKNVQIEESNQYLPPSESSTTDYPAEPVTADQDNQDIFRVQGLPRTESNNQFSASDEPSPRNAVFQQQQTSVQFQTNRQQKRIKSANNRVQAQNTFEEQPSSFQQSNGFSGNSQYGAPPAVEQGYGPPPNEVLSDDVQADTLVLDADPNVQNDEAEEESDYADFSDARPSIAVANSGSNGFARGQTGQYFILTPDNTVQRVQYQTSQNNNEAGFTAHLKYQPVPNYNRRVVNMVRQN